MKNLLSFTAIIELATGLMLIVFPSLITGFLFGSLPGLSSSIPFLRFAGVALSVLGVVCWLSRNHGQSRSTRWLIFTLMVYNSVIPVTFVYMSIGLHLSGNGLWPAVVVHLVLLIGCIMSVIDKTDQKTKLVD